MTLDLLAMQFTVMVDTWMDSEDPVGSGLQKLECLAELCCKIIRKTGVSPMTEPIADTFVSVKRALCVIDGLTLHDARSITRASIGAIPNSIQGYYSLQELPKTQMRRELVACNQLLRELIPLTGEPSPLRDLLTLVREAFKDIEIIVNAAWKAAIR